MFWAIVATARATASVAMTVVVVVDSVIPKASLVPAYHLGCTVTIGDGADPISRRLFIIVFVVVPARSSSVSTVGCTASRCQGAEGSPSARLAVSMSQAAF